jgi:hypothetical protein
VRWLQAGLGADDRRQLAGLRHGRLKWSGMGGGDSFCVPTTGGRSRLSEVGTTASSSIAARRLQRNPTFFKQTRLPPI